MFIRLLVTSVKHWSRSIVILVMFGCVLGTLIQPGYVHGITCGMRLNKRPAPIAGVETYPNLMGYPPNLPTMNPISRDHESCVVGCGRVITRIIENSKAYRENTQRTDERALAVTISATELTQPPPIVERTQPVTVSYSLTYPNGSSVRTAANATVSVEGEQTVRVPLHLNETSGVWIATWASPYSANLTEYSFKLTPADFSDAYGNVGIGSPVSSSSFKLIPASVALSIEALPTLSRKQLETIIIPAEYHDGSPLQNATLKATITDANGTASPINMTINGLLATKSIDLPADANLGTWQFSANFVDGYGNQGRGSITFEVVPAEIKFSVTLQQPVQRTTTMNVTSVVAYPDGQPLVTGVNGNVSIGNMTRSLNLQYLPNNETWNGLYYVSQNATLGKYNVTINAGDSDGNVGRFTTDVAVVPATFQISVQNPKIQVPPLNLTDIAVSVTYPNGTALGNNVGSVSATYNNSTGGVSTILLQYNATDTKWHVLFYTPDQRFKLYAITLVFGFEAHDIFGNYGSVSDALEMTVTTPISLLVLAAIIGVIVPASLLAWAMMTVTKKRRKHKP